MHRAPDDKQATLAGRRALREVTIAMGISLLLFAAILVAFLVGDRDVVAAIGALALAVGIVISLVVLRRAEQTAGQRSTALEEERRANEQLGRTLAATRRLVEIEDPADLHHQICVVAREVFDCAGVSLWRVEDDDIVMLAREPFVQPYEGQDRRPIAELPGLREAYDAGRPLFVDDMRIRSTGMTQATAEILGTGSMLEVPITFAGVAQLALALNWETVLPPPGPTERLAAERFAEQAALVLEQSLHRAAEAEVATLNRTLHRMVQTDPLFHAGGSTAEVAHAVCREALDIFGATGAALWVDVEEGIELVCRVPAAAIFGPRQQILFSEHPTFSVDLEGGQPRFIGDVQHDDPVLFERFGRHSNSRSQLRLPLASAGQARALIVLSWDEMVDPPTPAVLAVASRFADQAALALAEAARREAQDEVSALHSTFEERLLPSIDLAADDANVATFYRAGDERLTIGGDFYDCLELADGAIALLIGDVAGHGAAAAALGAGMRSAWRALVLGGWDLADIPRGLQAVCVRERDEHHPFVTAISARVEPDRRTMRFVSAGHPAPLLLGAPTAPASNGPPIGVVGDAGWQINEVALSLPATIVLYTDGLVEGRASPGSPERLGIEPIQARLAADPPGAVTEADLRDLVEIATTANGTGLPDDVALLALNLRG